MTPPEYTDVLIVGGGIMGAAVAALVRAERPEAQITIVDAGPAIADGSGHHLHETKDPELWEQYNEKVSIGIQGLYAADQPATERATALSDLEPGMHRIAALGHDSAQLPGAAVGWNVGGMGVHWTAATPWPEEAERFGDPDRWDRDLEIARDVLRVTASPIGPTTAGQHVLDALTAHLGHMAAPGRLPQAMPMAVRDVDGRLVRTGPAVIFPPIEVGGDEHFTLVSGQIVTELVHDGATVRGARTKDITTGEVTEIAAAVVVVAADALRSPQLLWASGIRPAALGTHLNEHAFVTNRVLLDLDRFGIALEELPGYRDGETVSDSLWVPVNSPALPYQCQVMNRTYIDDDANPLAYGVGVSVYVPTEVRAENRIVFSDEDRDIAGMPVMRAEFSWSEADLALIEQAGDFMAGIAERLGEWNRETDSQVLPAGSSLHYTGTVRAGDSDDGTSVCDHSGLVWGFDNLFVAGNGVVPTALVCNSTLTGTVTAVRAAEAVVVHPALAAAAAEEVCA
ncbi:GMC family oxidoreductase [Microbacterium sediminicola]|uniref:GMC family oxidoreductase n=1 Tax=Microbacterium sediminicola TaxID=415210 RepID=A0ABN2HGS6_9MICO